MPEVDAAALVAGAISDWVSDPDSDVEYAEWLDGRWAMRMRQSVRDATTVWWQVGERSVRAEAYLFPGNELGQQAMRLALVRNAGSWRTRIALDAEDSLVVRARLAVEALTRLELELTLAEIYDVVEITFPPLLKLHLAKR